MRTVQARIPSARETSTVGPYASGVFLPSMHGFRLPGGNRKSVADAELRRFESELMAGMGHVVVGAGERAVTFLERGGDF